MEHRYGANGHRYVGPVVAKPAEIVVEKPKEAPKKIDWDFSPKDRNHGKNSK